MYMDDELNKNKIDSLKKLVYYYRLKKLSCGLNNYEIKKYEETKEKLSKINTYVM